MLQLNYVDVLLEKVKERFCKEFEELVERIGREPLELPVDFNSGFTEIVFKVERDSLNGNKQPEKSIPSSTQKA